MLDEIIQANYPTNHDDDDFIDDNKQNSNRRFNKKPRLESNLISSQFDFLFDQADIDDDDEDDEEDQLSGRLNSSSTVANAITSNDSKANTSASNANSKKQRIHRYCPKLDSIKFNLLCEWDNCGKVLSDVDLFLNHIESHLSDYLAQHKRDNRDSFCIDCKWNQCDCTMIDNEATFQRHFRFHGFHTKLKEIGKNVLTSINESKSDKSMSNESNNDPTTTNKNNQTTIPNCNLDDQTRNLIPELPFKFECAWDGCEYNNDNPELFYKHIRDEHVNNFPKKPKDGKCLWSQCTQPLPSKYRLMEHIRHHSQEKVVACPVCGALFASFTKFLDHCSRSSKLGNLCFQCSHCNKKFPTNNLLKEHIPKHINKFKCPVCDMTCIDKNDLNKHILYKHTTHKAFKCTECDHTCKTHLDLQKHINLKHNDHYDYQCTECDFKTKELNNIKRHMLKFHLSNGENSFSTVDGQQFSCSYMCHVCNKVYCQGSTLSKHLKKRHNYKWFSGHSRFRYKLETDGYYRLQMLRYESLEIVEQLNKAGTTNLDSSVKTTIEHQQQQPNDTVFYDQPSTQELDLSNKDVSRNIAEIEQVLVLSKDNNHLMTAAANAPSSFDPIAIKPNQLCNITTLETASQLNNDQFTANFHAENFSTNSNLLNYCNLNTINIGNQSNLNYQESESNMILLDQASLVFTNPNSTHNLMSNNISNNNTHVDLKSIKINSDRSNLDLINNLTSDLTNNCGLNTNSNIDIYNSF